MPLTRRDFLLHAAGLAAAAGLQRMIREGTFRLAETGADAAEAGRAAWS